MSDRLEPLGMHSRRSLYLMLALLGLALGAQFEHLFTSSPVKKLTVGQHLLTARLSSDGSKLAGVGAVPGKGWFLQIWDDRGGEVLPPQTIPTPPGRFPSISWHSNNRELAVAAQGEVWVFDISTFQRRVLGAGQQVRQVDYREDTLLARTDQSVILWNARTYQQRFRLDQAHLLYAELDDSGEQLATSCFEDGVRIFDTRKKKLRAHLEPKALVAGLQFSNDSTQLTLGLRNRSDRSQDCLKTYELKSKKLLGPVLAAPSLRGFSIARKGDIGLARCGAEARVWNIKSGKLIAQREQQSRLVDCMNDSSTWIATTPVTENEVILWKTEGSRDSHRLRQEGAVTDAHFPDDDTLITVAGQATIWSL